MTELVMERIDFNILVTLFPGKILRSNVLVDKISKVEKMSAPKVYSRLKVLREAGFVKKIEINEKNVQYELTSKGNDIAKEHILISEERLKRLVNAIRNLPDPRQFVIDCMVANICDGLSKKWQLPKNKQTLEKILTKELDFREGQILEIINFSPVS